MAKPGPKPNPALRRRYRVIVSLPDDLAELVGWEGRREKSIIVADALYLWYAMSERERRARLAAVKLNQRRTTVQ